MRNAESICVLIAVLGMSHPAAAECSLDAALNFASELQVVQTELLLSVYSGEKTQQQLLTDFSKAFDSLKARMPQECAVAIDRAVTAGNKQCQLLNGAIERQLNLESYRTVAGWNYGVTGDRQALKSSLRQIMTTRLTSTPQVCWFEGTDLSGDGPEIEASAGQCAQLRAAFDNCKREAERALQTCTVTPWNRNCASTAPTCMPPPC